MEMSDSMSQITILWGVIRYEFKMQARRRWLWIVFAGIALVMLASMPGELINPRPHTSSMTLLQLVASITVDIDWLPLIGIGIFLADRFPRERNNRVDELFESMPGTLDTRLAGKYLGCLLATLLPAFLAYCFDIGLLAFIKHTLLVLPLALITYTTIVLPGACFITAFTLACTSFMWIPLYQFLFIGYWFWGNMIGPKFGLLTLSTTILTPVGGFIGAGLFGATSIQWTQGTSWIVGLISLTLMLIIPLLVMLLFYRYLRWIQMRK